MQTQKVIHFCREKKYFLLVFSFFIISFLAYFLLIKEKEREKEFVEEEIPLLEFIDLVDLIQDEGFISGVVKEINLREDKNSPEELIVEATLLINLETYFKNPPVLSVEKKFLKREGHPFRDSSSFFINNNTDQETLFDQDVLTFEMDLRKLKEGDYVEVFIDGDFRDIMRKDYYFPRLIRWISDKKPENRNDLLELVPHMEEMRKYYGKQAICGRVENVLKEENSLKEVSLSIIMPYWFVNSSISSLLRDFSVVQSTEFRQGNPKEVISKERFLNENYETADFWQKYSAERKNLYDLFDPVFLENGDLLCVLVEEDIREIIQREVYTLIGALKIIQ